MKALLLHAYSAKNKGDGLLVYETIDLLKKNFGDDVEVDVICMNAPTFKPIDNVSYHQFAMVSSGYIGYITIFLAALVSMVHPAYLLPKQCKKEKYTIVLGVGGGYVRITSPMQCIKFFLAHYQQMRLLKHVDAPAVYLSQSVGPLNGFFGSLVKAKLHKLNAIFLRDDRSMVELNSKNSIRVPDLAVIKIADVDIKPKYGNKICFVFRDLNKNNPGYQRYIENIKDIVSRYPSGVLALQSEGAGNDDSSFYERIFPNNSVLDINELYRAKDISVVVSVRLHGALQSIIEGYPTIHLSYERKGYGAFSDLDISRFVHNAFNFDLALVCSQIDQLVEDSSDYWRAIEASKPSITKKAEAISNVLLSVKGKK